MSLDAMKQALGALDGTEALLSSMDVTHLLIYGEVDKAITELRAAIEQAEKQEPVAWKWKERVNNEFDSWVITASEPPPYAIETHPLYTAPRQWQRLTNEERNECVEWAISLDGTTFSASLARAIEAKLREKNT